PTFEHDGDRGRNVEDLVAALREATHAIDVAVDRERPLGRAPGAAMEAVDVLRDEGSVGPVRLRQPYERTMGVAGLRREAHAAAVQVPAPHALRRAQEGLTRGEFHRLVVAAAGGPVAVGATKRGDPDICGHAGAGQDDETSVRGFAELGDDGGGERGGGHACVVAGLGATGTNCGRSRRWSALACYGARDRLVPWPFARPCPPASFISNALARATGTFPIASSPPCCAPTSSPTPWSKNGAS